MANGGITYRTHIQGIGWQGWKSNGALSGTSGKAKRLEAIQIKLTGELANKYDIYYRVHAQRLGWLGWAKNGASAGTSGRALRLEAIQIKLVEKGGKAPGVTYDSFFDQNTSSETAIKATSKVAYRAHMQTYGWQAWQVDGATAGAPNKKRRVEGLNIRLNNQLYAGGIEYRAHVQGIGWQSWVRNGALSGTSGKSKRIEAVQIRLTGEMANKFDVYYRVNAQYIGWLGWAKNGQQAGSSGFGFRLEGLQVKLVKKGGVAPEGTQSAFISPSDGGFNTKQLRILSAAQRVPWAGSGRCAAWVEIVYQAAGLGIINGNACDLWRRYCHTSDIKELGACLV